MTRHLEQCTPEERELLMGPDDIELGEPLGLDHPNHTTPSVNPLHECGSDIYPSVTLGGDQ